MEKIQKLLDEQLNESLIQIVISNVQKKGQAGEMQDTIAPDKVKVRPILIAQKLMFQETLYANNQVFHTNYSKEEIADRILNMLENRFGQLQLTSESCQANVLISKKGTVTVKKKTQNAQAGKERLSHNKQKKYIIQEGEKVPFLEDLGVFTREGKIVSKRYDKVRQINRFLEFIEDILPALDKNRTISILDFGCGKSYLTFAMYYYLKEKMGYDIEVIGLDLKTEVIKNCNELAKKYGYQKLTFLQGDIKDYKDKDEIDMVVTLHACDTATDYAIAKAIGWNAKVILSVPCCQHEINKNIKNDLLAPVLKYGLIKERMSALLTDAVRANLMEMSGYETQVLEFIDMEHTPKNILLRGVKKEGMRKKTMTMENVDGLLGELHTGQTLADLLRGNYEKSDI